MQTLTFALSAATIALTLLAIVYTFGVIWRVEMRLDLSYKLLLAAIVFFLLAEILSFVNPGNAAWFLAAIIICKFVFAALFLAAILTARNMLRSIDGEKKESGQH